MTEVERIKYEELYNQCWIAQCKKDKKDNPRLENLSPHFKGGYARSNKKGGRPKTKVVENFDLSEKAQVINRMMIKGLKNVEISELLGITRQAVSRTKSRYQLPR
tara:strand:+ start:439 stop:753 length:315 start_codon:yes stop_codon:yes gene_type:complete